MPLVFSQNSYSSGIFISMAWTARNLVTLVKNGRFFLVPLFASPLSSALALVPWVPIPRRYRSFPPPSLVSPLGCELLPPAWATAVLPGLPGCAMASAGPILFKNANRITSFLCFLHLLPRHFTSSYSSSGSFPLSPGPPRASTI